MSGQQPFATSLRISHRYPTPLDKRGNLFLLWRRVHTSSSICANWQQLPCVREQPCASRNRLRWLFSIVILSFREAGRDKHTPRSASDLRRQWMADLPVMAERYEYPTDDRD